jgi:ATP-binding cassette subfamily F protein 3
VLTISHEPKFLDAVCIRIVELDEHKLHDYTGDYSNYLRVKEQLRESQISAYERQQRELDRQQNSSSDSEPRTPKPRR